jgi:hypothetical protein
MSWLLSSALWAAGAAVLVAIALHFIARSRPLAESLPTARFVPQRPVHARARSIALSDVVLLLLRIAALLALGAAVAGPVFAVSRGRVTRIIVVDRSRDVGDAREARDSARSVFRDGDVLVAFDSVATRLSGSTALDSSGPTDARGSLSAALAISLRIAAQLSPRSDSFELVVASPVSADEIDQATLAIRTEWPGRIRLVPLRGAAGNARAARVESAMGQNDLVIAGLSLMGVVRANANVRIARDRPSRSDTVWARDSGHVLVAWPATDGATAWEPRSSIDAIGGVTSSTGVLIGRFPRVWALRGHAVARWADGEPAVVENAVGRGCIRDVGILFDPASDITLRAPFRQFVAALLAPCGGIRPSARADSLFLASFVGGPPVRHLAASSALRERTTESSTWTPWLFGLGAILLVVEMAVRKSDRRMA